MQKNKKRRILVSSIVIIIVVYFLFGGVHNDLSRTENVNIYMPVNNDFYYSQLSDSEKQVYGKMEILISACAGGYVEFDSPISHLSYSKIIQTFEYDNSYGRWMFVQAFPVAENNVMQSMDTLVYENEATICNIIGVYIQLLDDENREELNSFTFDISEKNVLSNSKEFLEVLRNNELSVNDYTDYSTQIQEAEEQIIRKLQNDADEKKAIMFFSNWLKNNIEYDGLMEQKLNNASESKQLKLAVEYANLAHEQCIIKKKAICSGYAIALSKLCNKVGIESYVVLGKITRNNISEYHAWTAVVIDGEILYTDPTQSVVGAGYFGLRTKDELLNYSYNGITYEFLPYFYVD